MYVCMYVRLSFYVIQVMYIIISGLSVIDCGFVKLKAFSPKTSLGRATVDLNFLGCVILMKNLRC